MAEHPNRPGADDLVLRSRPLTRYLIKVQAIRDLGPENAQMTALLDLIELMNLNVYVDNAELTDAHRRLIELGAMELVEAQDAAE